MVRDIPGLLAHLGEEFKSRVDVGVIGLSGGADSTLVATLATLYLGKGNVFGVSMPFSETDASTFNARSANLADRLGIPHSVVPVNDIAAEIYGSIEEACDDFIGPSFRFAHTINRGNARSRARMCLLYGIAWELGNKLANKKVRVLGTGNLSEDFIGYDTKGGDALCDWFPIGSLFKSEVYQLLEHFRDEGILDESLIDRVPSAGLWEGQTDEGELGYSYNEMESVIKELLPVQHCLADAKPSSDISKFIIGRHLANKHKHEGPPAADLRRYCD